MTSDSAFSTKASPQTILLLLLIAFWANGCGFFRASHHDPLDYKAIDAAAEGGDLEKLKEILKHDPTLLRSKEWGDLIPLNLAILHNHKEVTEYLLAQGSNVNAKTSRGVTPLHEAAQNGNREIVELLLAQKSININAVDDQGWTPLIRAQKWNHPEIAELLREHGAK